MRRVLLFSAFVLCLSTNAKAQSPKPAMKAQAARPAATASPSPAAVQAARASFAKLPLSFEENVGQTDGRVKYMSRGSGYSLFLTADQAVFALRDGSVPPNCTGLSRKIAQDCARPSNQRNQESVLWLKMVGANSSAQILGSDLLPGKINYYVGNDPSKWRTGVRQFGRVNYHGIYPGVDLTYYGNQQQLESDFVVAPGSNPRSIQFEVKGARETRLDAQGNLILASEAGDVRLLRPVVYQVIKGSKQDVSGRYVLLAENRVGFEIGKYDAHKPLVIDPTFVYSTYLGGATLFSGGDQGLAVAIDAAGAAYVTGMGGSSDFPGSALSGPVAQSTPFAFVTKFDPTGSSLVYSTLLRGTTGFSDSGNGIGVDSSGNAYVDGITGDSDFPLLNPFQATIGDVFSAGTFNFLQSGFVAGLAGDGTLIYSTYFGGRNNSDQTTLNGLAADASGNAYVVGNTNSQNFPTVNPYQATQNSTFGGQNVVVAKFNPQGQPIYSTYLGGGGSEIGDAIAIDGNGNAYVTGQTSSNAMIETGFPVQTAPAPFQGALNGSANAFVAKFTFASPTLSLDKSTYLGGGNTDEGFGIAVDNATPPNVYVTGQTNSKAGTPFPTKNPIFGPSAGTFSEAFVTKLKGDFTALIYSTFLGGTGSAVSFTGDTGSAIDLDGANPPNAFVTGSTPSIDFPVPNALQSTIGPGATSNAFVTEVNGAGSALIYSTYLGGRGSDKGLGIAVDSAGNAYITGTATSPNFPVVGSGGTAPYQGELRTSAGNAFLTKISSAAAPSALNFFPPSFDFHSVGVGQASAPESVTLSNNTASAVTINVGGITFTGANGGDFSQTNTCPVSPATLAAGASCTISVVFNPALQDGRTAQLSVASSAPAAAMNLSGFGAVPEVSFSQTSINFGTNDPLHVGVTNFLSITNKGGAPLHVGNVEITGADAAAFAITFNGCTAAVAANGGSCFIEPSFTPTTAGHAYSATLLINDDAAGSPQSISMSGTGAAQVIVSPHTLEYGGWLVGTSSFDNSISLLNGTAGNITLTSIAPGGSSGDFPIDPNNGTTCVANLVLLPGVSCNLEVFFKPTVGSAFDGRTATYTFNWTGAASGSQAVTVMGTGETGFTLYQNSYTAPSEFVGATESRTNFDQVFNGNASPVTVSSIVITGANPQDFVVQLDTSCSTNGVVAANSVCFLDGSFSPSAVGTRSATVTINYTPPGGSSLILNVSGTGLAGPVVFPANYDMGSQIVGLTGPTQRVVLQNVQKAQLAISTVTPPAGTEFAIASSSTCKSGVNVPGGGNCFFDLTFKPGATGSRTASVVVTDNGPGSPRTLNLTGTGAPAADTISVSPNALDFGNVVLVVPSSAQPTVTETFYLINAGTTSTTISIAPAVTTAGTPFALATGGAAGTCVLNKVVLPQGGACTVAVTFKPTGTGLQTNSVTLTDSVGGLHTISIQGTGVNQGVMSFGSSPTFTQLPSTTTATPLTATLTNSGSGPLTINSLYLTGANATDFAIVPGQTTCAPGTTGMIIPAAPGPGNTCVVALTFTAPSTVGTYKANVSVSADLGNNVKGSTSTNLTGNVVAGGLSASPNPIDFGTVALGNMITYSSLHSFNSITVTNNNPATVTITNVAPQTAGDFTVTGNNCLTTLQPPAQFSSTNTCTFDVTFAPTVNGAEPTNKIVVTYNVTGGASGQQFLIPLTGAGSNALVAMPNPLNVSAAVGGFGGNPTITIGNGSASTINITAVGAITGAGAANYTVSFEFCTGTALQPTGSAFGTTCQISLNFNPTAPGTNVAAQIPVSYNIGGGSTQTLTVNLNSSATAAQVSITPSQTPSPTPLIFGAQALNTQSLVLSVLVTNSGNDVLNISNVKITGANSNDFALAPQQQNSPTSQYASVIPCSNFGFGSLDPGQSCTIPLTFTPAPPPLPGGSTRNATLTITDNAYPSKTQTVLLEGNASSGSVTASPVALTFPDTSVGSSATQSVLVTNGSSSAVTVTSVTFGTTSYSVDAAQTLNACSSSKPLSAFTGSCVVYIKFSPKTGANPDTATIHTSANSPAVTLSGNGVNPNVNATPTTLTFSSQAVGTQSSPQAVTLSNPTGTAVTISSTPSISGTNPGDFILGTNSCTTGANVPATTGSCVVNVIFKPGAAGGTGRTATLSISDSPDATSPHLVTLSGTAIQPVASLSGSTLAFGNSNVGVATSQMTVTLTNTGNASLNLSNIVLGGTNPGDFAIVVPSSGTQCTNTTVLAASASCVVAATFTPTAANARSATITITDNATPTTQVITLSGTGTQPGVSFLPTTIPFGNQRQGVASGQMTTVLTNSGTGSLTITSVTLTGTNQGDFALVAPASGTDCRTVGTVAAAGSCTIAVTFTPGALGGRSAAITVADNASGSPHTAAVTGTGVFPQATPTPSPLAFGNQRQNTTSAVQTLTLTNGGTGTLNLTTVVLGGTNANQFAIVGTGTTCTNGSTVAAGGNCVVKVTFTPTGLGGQAATITFTDDASPTTQVVNVTGTGVFPQATPTPSPLAFGNQRQNVTSAAQTLTLTNGGTGTLNLTTVALGGTNANQFAIVGTGTTCTNGSTVAAGANCVVKVTFTPTSLGAQTATITFTDDASPTTQVVNVTGTGVFPQASAAPGTVPFGSQTNGITSGPQTITLTNGGTGVLHITTVALGGTNPGAFAIVGGTTTCTNGGTVNAGSSCVVNVTFTPTGLGALAATLTITDDASPTTQVVNLTGTGVTSTVNFSPSPVAFGNQRQGTPSAQMTTVLTNSGASTLTITSVTVTGTNQGDFSLVAPASGTDCRTVGTVAATGSCTIAVTFTPGALGGRSATITVADNASGSPHTAAVTGTGVFPQATPTPSPLGFANQIQGTTSTPLTVTLTNGGTDVLHITTVALGGANPADFAIAAGTTCTNGSTVAAGNTCIVNLTFTPATANPFSATLTFTNDASPTTQTVNLSGTGVTPPTATLSSGSISFGNQRVNTVSTAQNVTITNNGGAPLSITTIAITGTNASDFAFASPATTCPTTVSGQVAPAASCTLSVTFDPAAANARSASITITVSGIANPTPVTVSGTGIAPVATPAGTGAFGNQEVSTSSAALNGTLNNTGTDVLHITAVAITGTNASDFSIVAAGTSCATGLPTPVNVAAAANCTWSVKFTPTALGSRTASLTFTDDSGATAGSTQTITLSGMGTAPVVQLAPTTVSFLAQAVSTTSAPMNGTLTNTGTTTLHLATVTITGTNSGDFAIVSGGTTCINGSTVAPTNGTCTWSVTFTPSAVGTRTATLTFTDDNNGVPGSMQTVALTGVTPPAATLSPSTPIAFGNQGVGTTSSASSITVMNPGGSTLHIATVAISGTNAADFAVATTGTTCTNGSTVAPAASCIINLTFTPAAAGSRGPATLTITDDASPTTQTVSLSGTGISFSLSVSTPPAPETAGTPITATIQLTPGTGGFPNAVTFSASNLPPDTTAAFSQTTLTPGSATVTTTLTLTTTVRSGGNSSSIPPSHTPISGGWMATALLALMAMLTMRRGFRLHKFAYLPLAVLLLSAAIITGCSTAPTGTPAGSYTVNVKATSGSYSQSTPVAITVK